MEEQSQVAVILEEEPAVASLLHTLSVDMHWLEKALLILEPDPG